jgi:hypothetical protein
MRTVNYLIKNKGTVIMLTMLSIVLVCCKSQAPATKSTASTTSSSTASTANPNSLVPGNNDVTIAQSHWPGTSLTNLADGFSLYNNKCVDCHEAKLPQDFSVDDWNAILPKMGRKAHLDSLQYKSVYRYILAKRETILSAKK